MSRYAVRIGSALALLAVLTICALPARADERLVLRLDGKAIVLTHVRAQGSSRAVAADDPGLLALLDRIGATLTWQPGERYILFTTAEPTVIGFSLGDSSYDVGPVRETAPFKPFLLDGHPYVPLDELIHALEFAIETQGSELVLQPQLAAIEVQSGPNGARVVAHAGIPLDGRITFASGDAIVITFDGVGSTLQSGHIAPSGPVQRVDVRTAGTASHPQTQVTLTLARGTSHGEPASDDQRDFVLTLGGGAVASATTVPEAVESAPSSPSAASGSGGPQPQPSAPPVQVTAVDVQPQNGAMLVRISVNGNSTYDWHRLRPPDNRFWLDVHDARLAIPAMNQPGSNPVESIRVHQENPDTVRIALSLSDFDLIDVTPNATGVVISVNSAMADDGAARSGSGTIGMAAAASDNWKFAPKPGGGGYVAANPRLIVIDPGHGGSDPGSYRGDAVEKVITLDISKRLRDILTARGWQVMMTRDDDRDVYQPNDDATDELQARDDVANHNGARLLVSVHVNAFMNAGPHGATVYYYKQSDYALAQAIDKRVASELTVKNDGVVKDKLYVIHHANMPASLIETAFVSNPDDRALLQSPQWRQEMAQAIADGIEDFAGSAPPASTASDP
jgi:N-acetylmuramoyl-L-alanine amidase CwlD